MKQGGLTLHHWHAPALLGQEVMSLNTLLGVSNCACAKIKFLKKQKRSGLILRSVSDAELFGFEEVGSRKCVRVLLLTLTAISASRWFNSMILLFMTRQWLHLWAE